MADNYPEYDWRGLAMLAQQVGQLFEPNKAKLMSRQHEHEMNLLAAEQSWKFETEKLDSLKLEYNNINKQLLAKEQDVKELGLGDLVRAGSLDGANQEESAEVYNNLDVKTLTDLQDLSARYIEMISEKQENIDNMLLFNEHAKAGNNFRTGSIIKKHPKTGAIIDYYQDADIDGATGLSFEEGQKMIKQYITDNYAVAEGEEGMEMNFGSGDDAETIMVRPEALAFRAGWESQTGTGTGRGKAEQKQISDKQAIENNKDKLLGGKTPLKMSPEELIKSTLYNKKIFEDIDNSNPEVEAPLGLYMEMSQAGDFIAKEQAYKLGFKRDDVNLYSSAYSNYTNGLKELLRRQIPLPGEVTQASGILTKMQVPNDQAIQIMQDFGIYNSNPDTLLTQINTYEPLDEKSPPKEQLHQAYTDFLKQLPTMNPQKRREGIQRFTKLIGQ